jgi:chaperonin cofactor prefoldin
VITLPVETWATIGTLLAALVGLYVALRGDIHREVQRLESRLDTRMDRLESRMDRFETRVERLDDRVYALAAGLRPQLEAARADET